MQTIPNVTSQPIYVDALTLEDTNAVAATYVVANNAVYAQFRPKRRDGTLAPYGPELLLSPQSNNMVGVGGMRFRSVVVGAPAQVIAAMYDADDPLPGAATPFSQTISASGGVTPGLAAVQVQVDGALIGSEPTVNLLSTLGIIPAAADDPANSRVNLTLPLGSARLAEAIIGGGGGVPTFSAIPQTYRHLIISWIGVAAAGATEAALFASFNGDATTNYDYMVIESFNGAANAAQGSAVTAMFCGLVGTTGGGAYSGVVFIPCYRSGFVGKGALGISAGFASARRAGIYAGTWRGTAAVSSIALTAGGSNFSNGSQFTLYGLT